VNGRDTSLDHFLADVPKRLLFLFQCQFLVVVIQRTARGRMFENPRRGLSIRQGLDAHHILGEWNALKSRAIDHAGMIIPPGNVNHPSVDRVLDRIQFFERQVSMLLQGAGIEGMSEDKLAALLDFS